MSTISSGDVLARLQAFGKNAAGAFTAVRAAIQAIAAENHTDTNQGAYVAITTTPIGSTATAEVVRVTDAGKVGIGTTAPAKLVEVVTQSADAIRLTSYNNGSAAAAFQSVKARGTLAAPLRTQNGDVIASFNGFGYWSTDNTSSGTLSGLLAQFQYVASQNFTSTGMGTYWILKTTAISSTIPAQRIQVDENGITLTSTTFVLSWSASLHDNSSTGTATLTNAPATGNPTKWIAINDNGTTRYIPCW